MYGNQLVSTDRIERSSSIIERGVSRKMERFVLTGHSIFSPKLEESVVVTEDPSEVIQDEEVKEEEEGLPGSQEEEEEDKIPREEGEKEAMFEV